MVQSAQNKGQRIINLKEERHPSEPLFTLNKYMLVFDYLNSSLAAIFNFFKPFNEQHSHNTTQARV